MHLQHLPMHRNPRQRSKRYIVPTWILCEVQVPQVSWLQRETFDKSLNIIYSCPLPPPPHIVRYTRYTCRMFQASESWVSNHNSLCCDAWGLCKLPKIIDIFLKCLKDKPFQLRNMQKKNRVTLVNLNIHSKRPRECSHKKCNSFFPFLHLCASTHGRCKANHIRLPQSKWCNQRDVAVQFLLSWLLYILIFY